MVVTSEGFLGVAIEKQPDWNSKRRTLAAVQMLLLTDLSGHAIESYQHGNVYRYSDFNLR